MGLICLSAPAAWRRRSAPDELKTRYQNMIYNIGMHSTKTLHRPRHSLSASIPSTSCGDCQSLIARICKDRAHPLQPPLDKPMGETLVRCGGARAPPSLPPKTHVGAAMSARWHTARTLTKTHQHGREHAPIVAPPTTHNVPACCPPEARQPPRRRSAQLSSGTRKHRGLYVLCHPAWPMHLLRHCCHHSM